MSQIKFKKAFVIFIAGDENYGQLVDICQMKNDKWLWRPMHFNEDKAIECDRDCVKTITWVD